MSKRIAIYITHAQYNVLNYCVECSKDEKNNREGKLAVVMNKINIQQVYSICNYQYLYSANHFDIISCFLMYFFADKPGVSTPFTSESQNNKLPNK